MGDDQSLAATDSECCVLMADFSLQNLGSIETGTG